MDLSRQVPATHPDFPEPALRAFDLSVYGEGLSSLLETESGVWAPARASSSGIKCVVRCLLAGFELRRVFFSYSIPIYGNRDRSMSFQWSDVCLPRIAEYHRESDMTGPLTPLIIIITWVVLRTAVSTYPYLWLQRKDSLNLSPPYACLYFWCLFEVQNRKFMNAGPVSTPVLNNRCDLIRSWQLLNHLLLGECFRLANWTEEPGLDSLDFEGCLVAPLSWGMPSQ
jgi:hypothetical protein